MADSTTLLVNLIGNTSQYKTSMSSAANETRRFGAEVENTDTKTRTLSEQMNSASGRVGLLVKSLVAIGPAAVPISAAAVPALASVGTASVAAAGAIGALTLAFYGVGDAITAVSDYQLEPTAENLEKVRQAFDKIGPAGASFVMTLYDLKPALDQLRQTAGEGIFPGFEEGLAALESQLPGVNSLVADLSTTIGRLGADAGKSLAGDRDWQEFFDYLQSDAAPTLETFGRATGNFVAGVANLLEALSGISGSATNGLLDMSVAFREWADGLENTQGFQEFADYLTENGPKVGDLLIATAEALVATAEAAAPWGAAVLPILTTTARVFGALMDSPVGPVLFAAAAGFMAVNRATGLLGPGIEKATKGIKTARTTVLEFGTGLRNMKQDAAVVASQGAIFGPLTKDAVAASERLNKTRGSIAAIGNAAKSAGPGLAAMTLQMTGAADKMGLSNTAMLTMAGSMAGPWGAAAGAAVGVTMDLAHANDDLKASIKAADAAMATGGLEQLTAQAKELKETLDETTDNDWFGFDLPDLGGLEKFSGTIAPLSNMKRLMGDLTGETDKAKAKLEQVSNAKAGLEGLAVALGASKTSATEMASGSKRAQEAMDALGISNKELAAAQKAGGAEFEAMSGQITAWVAHADSVQGRTQSVADAVADLGNDALTTADSAMALSSALEALLAPNMDLEEATDNWKNSLKKLRTELNATAGFGGDSEAAMKNREATRTYLDDSMKRLEALANVSTTTEKDMANAVAATRDEFIKSGMAAGFSRKEMEARAKAMGLTPDLVETVFKAAGITEADRQARDYAAQIKKLPKKLQTEIKANGIPKTKAEVDALAKKYDLTPKQKSTLMKLTDKASPEVKKALEKLGLIPKSKSTKLEAKDNASKKIGSASKAADKFGEKSPSAVLSIRDAASKGIRAVGRRLAEYGEKVGTGTAALKDSASRKIDDVRGQLGRWGRSVGTGLASLRDSASSRITTVRGALSRWGRSSASALLSVRDNASATISSVARGLANIPRTVTSTITTIAKKITGKADGGLYSGGVLTFADGGYGENGRYYTRDSQIVAGGANITWAEPETGWEAYISGKPEMRARNLLVLAEAASRLGAEVVPQTPTRAFADGGMYGRTPIAAANSTVVIPAPSLPDRLTLVVDGHQFTAYVREHAADVAHQTASSADAVSTQHGRMVWA